MSQLAKAVSYARSWLYEFIENRRLAPLYSPDPTNLDLDQHLSAALDWLKRAQDAGSDRGVSWGVKFGSDYELSYPETTGYIIQTFVRMYRRTGQREYLERAIDMGLWEAEIQMSEGAVMGGKVNPSPTPAVFNTGMVLLGWTELIRETGDERFRAAATRAAKWLLQMQDPDGNWRRGNSRYANASSTVYNVKAAWGLCEAGLAVGCQDFVNAAVRNAEYCLTRQQPNGWFLDCCLNDPSRPLLHTIAYTMQGLVEIGRLTQRSDFIEAARRTSDAQIALLGPDGYLPGRQDSRFRAASSWACLTGTAQTSIVWRALFDLTRDLRYCQAANLANSYLMARHDIRNPDPRLRGGVPGSWPVTGGYGRLQILNWATKFLADALIAEQDSHSPWKHPK
jgi:uncharacterized protein YyaL (SSP411 family)